MCGNRLNAWNTIPIRRRIRSTSHAPGGDLVALDEDPPGVDRLDQVDAAQERGLAAPGGADQARRPRARRPSRSMPRSTSRSPNDLCRPWTASAGGRPRRHRAPAAPRARSRATSQSVKPGERDRHDDEHERHRDVGREVEGRGRLDLRRPEDLDHADVRHQHRVLLQADEVVEERRDHPPDGLRDDHVAQRLEPRAGRATGRPPPGSGGWSRCRRGRPRTRTPSR